MNNTRILLIFLICSAIGLFFYFDLQQLLSLEMLKSKQAEIADYRAANPISSIIQYAVIYIVVTSLSLPGAAILTLAGGALFGLFTASIVVSFASSIGATLAFLAARFLFRDAVNNKFGDRLNSINEGISRDGPFYLFGLRLVPIFPFFMINLLMGLSSIKTWTFYWVSQLGMLAGTLVYVNAGTQISQIDALSDILSPALLGSFVLLGIFPLLSKFILQKVQQAKIYAPWSKPKQFDTNIVVIGGGSAGLVSALIAAAVKAKVTLVEKHKMGGDCLNTGCVPSKALIRSARFIAQLKRANEYGIQQASVEFDFAELMQRVQNVVAKIAPHDSIERFNSLGVDVLTGSAKIISPWQVEVSDGQQKKVINTRAIVIAAGARPFVPPIPGLDKINYLTSDTIWNLRVKPERLLVLGGGPIGCELAQTFARLGVAVTQIEMLPRIMIREDPEVSAAVLQRFKQEGITVLLQHTAKQFLLENKQKILLAEHQNQTVRIAFDEVLIAIGRAANVTGYGIEEMDIRLSARKTVEIDAFQASNYPNIYACGDVSGPYQFTHTASHQAWYATVNALFGSFKKFKTDYSVIPWATFTDPEVARVGLNEQEAQQQGINYEISRYDINELDRAIADSEAYGFVKVLTRPGNDKILGVTIVGNHAGDLIAEFVLAMKHGLGLNKILGTIHIYPTMSEANKYVAGVWKRQNAPQTLLNWVEKYHTWRRES